MAAEYDSFGLLGKDAAFDVAAKETDSKLLGNASTATCAVWGHSLCRSWKEGEAGPNVKR